VGDAEFTMNATATFFNSDPLVSRASALRDIRFSGQFDVPLRYAVVREGIEPKTIVTKFRRIPTVMPPGAGNVAFTDIEEDLSFPMPAVDELQAYIVYVGFDDVGDRNDRRQPAKKAKAK